MPHDNANECPAWDEDLTLRRVGRALVGHYGTVTIGERRFHIGYVIPDRSRLQDGFPEAPKAA